MQIIDGKKITIFTSEEKRVGHRPLYEVVMEELQKAGIATAILTRGVAGFGGERKISTINIEVLSFNLPIIIEATDTVEKIDRVAPSIAEILEGGVIDIIPVQMIRRLPGEAGRVS